MSIAEVWEAMCFRIEWSEIEPSSVSFAIPFSRREKGICKSGSLEVAGSTVERIQVKSKFHFGFPQSLAPRNSARVRFIT